MHNTVVDGFMNRVRKTYSCWIWEGKIRADGYGYVAFRRKSWGAHRVSYTLFKGEIGPGLLVCHTCDNPACVNPEHLWMGTNSDNNKDMVAKGRGRCNRLKGTGHHLCKLTDDKVREIRRRYASGEMQKNLRTEFGLSLGHISDIISGKKWAHIPATTFDNKPSSAPR